MGEQGEAEGDVRTGERDGIAQTAEIRALGAAGALPDELRRHGNEGGKSEAENDQLGPHEGRAVWQDPPEYQGEIGGGRGERPAQVGEPVPATDRRDAGPRGSVARRAADQPGEELPVAPNPAMLARRRHLL